MSSFSQLFSPPSPGTVGYPSEETSTAAQSFDWNQLVVKPLENSLFKVLGFLPDFLTALCILLAGWVIGKILQFFVSRFLKSLGFDQFAPKIGFCGWSDSAGKSITPHRCLGMATFWVAMFISIIMSLEQIRLKMASVHLDHFLQFVFSLLAAVVILIVGMFLSLALSKIIQATASHLKMGDADRFASLTKWIVLGFTMLVCLGQLGLPMEMVFVALAAIFGTLCLTFILAFGIGGRAWAGKVLEMTIKDRKN